MPGHPCTALNTLRTFVGWLRSLAEGDMGLLLVHVSPWFRGNVVVTWKIGNFLCSLDNLLKKKKKKQKQKQKQKQKKKKKHFYDF